MDAIEFKRGRVPKHRPSTGYVALFFDSSVGAFRYVNSAGTITAIGSAGGVSEAPIDGTSYVRKDAAWVAAGAGSSILTTKGDLWGFAAVDARIPIGADGEVLTADSTNANGLKWAAAGGSGLTHPQVSARIAFGGF